MAGGDKGDNVVEEVSAENINNEVPRVNVTANINNDVPIDTVPTGEANKVPIINLVPGGGEQDNIHDEQ